MNDSVVEFYGENINITVSKRNIGGAHVQSADLAANENGGVLRKYMIAGAVTFALFAGSPETSGQAANGTSIPTASFSSPQTTDGRLTFFNGRRLISPNPRKQTLAVNEGLTTSHNVSGEPFPPMPIKTVRYSLAERSSVKTIELTDNMAIHFQSAYVKLSSPVMETVGMERGSSKLVSNTPTFLRLYAEDISNVVKDQPIKLTLAALMAALTSWFNIHFIVLIVGLFALAVLDCILGLIPGNAKPGTEADQRVQAKMMGFFTNFIIITGVVIGSSFLSFYTNGNAVLGFITNNLHYAVAGWLYVSIYIWRFVKYGARANKANVPKFLRKFFDDAA